MLILVRKYPISSILSITRIFLKKKTPSIFCFYWTLTWCKKKKKIDKSNALVIRDGRYRQTRVRYSKWCYKWVDGRINRAKFIGTFSRGRDQIKWITRVLKLILYILIYVLHADLNIFYQIKGLHIGSDSALIVFYSLFIF